MWIGGMVGLLVELVGHWCYRWAGALYAGWLIVGDSRGLAYGKSRVSINLVNSVGP